MCSTSVARRFVRLQFDLGHFIVRVQIEPSLNGKLRCFVGRFVRHRQILDVPTLILITRVPQRCAFDLAQHGQEVGEDIRLAVFEQILVRLRMLQVNRFRVCLLTVQDQIDVGIGAGLGHAELLAVGTGFNGDLELVLSTQVTIRAVRLGHAVKSEKLVQLRITFAALDEVFLRDIALVFVAEAFHCPVECGLVLVAVVLVFHVLLHFHEVQYCQHSVLQFFAREIRVGLIPIVGLEGQFEFGFLVRAFAHADDAEELSKVQHLIVVVVERRE